MTTRRPSGRDWMSTDHEQTALKRQTDQLVYKLYGLTDAEMEIVETAAE